MRVAFGSLPDDGLVEFKLPEAAAITMAVVRTSRGYGGYQVASLRTVSGDWAAYRAISLWLFHTPPGALPDLPPGVPAIASRGSH